MTHRRFTRDPGRLRSPWRLFSLMVLVPAAAFGSYQASPPLFDNLGTLHHTISTTSEQAQRYFDQGLRLTYAFNHEEAIRSFEEASRLDHQAAMPYWGIALALGPNINATMSKDNERRAIEAVKHARARLDRTSDAERAYIDALTKRYVAAKHVKRAALDKTYADAMRSLWRQYPHDPDAGVLFAEALMDLRPWDFWTEEGQQKRGTEEIVTTLEAIMEGIWRLGRGLALAATGRVPGAAGEHYALAGLTRQIRRTHSHEEKVERDLLKVAERLLAGDVATHQRRYDEAIKALKEASKLEAGLQYSEPPLWPLSVRQYLGPVLLMAHRPAEAEAEYRADLKRFPENGWALFGLAQSLKAQHKDQEAGETERRFEKAWAYADVTLTASRF